MFNFNDIVGVDFICNQLIWNFCCRYFKWIIHPVSDLGLSGTDWFYRSHVWCRTDLWSIWCFDICHWCSGNVKRTFSRNIKTNQLAARHARMHYHTVNRTLKSLCNNPGPVSETEVIFKQPLKERKNWFAIYWYVCFMNSKLNS